jgi:hypothetical protein
MSLIFLSHSSQNDAQAVALEKWLKDNGWDEVFLDINPARGLAPGERWQEALRAAANRCEAVVFLVSPAWAASRWCLAEFLLAKSLNKTIFGVVVDAVPLDRLPVEMTAEWQLCHLVGEGLTQSIPITLRESQTRVAFLSAGLEHLKIGLHKARLSASYFPWPPPGDPKRAPFRGLKALDVDDAAIFFGRDAEIIRAFDTLRGMRGKGVERLLIIRGTSGSGKSSFMRAGLWRCLKRDDRHFFPLPVIRPKNAVISDAEDGLAKSLLSALEELGHRLTLAQVKTQLSSGPQGFDKLLADCRKNSVQ